MREEFLQRRHVAVRIRLVFTGCIDQFLQVFQPCLPLLAFFLRKMIEQSAGVHDMFNLLTQRQCIHPDRHFINELQKRKQRITGTRSYPLLVDHRGRCRPQ